MPIIELTDEQIANIKARIAVIEKHFSECCGFQRDVCQMQEEYDTLNEFLELITDSKNA